MRFSNMPRKQSLNVDCDLRLEQLEDRMIGSGDRRRAVRHLVWKQWSINTGSRFVDR